jgi:alpha-1,2-mannosyltransferase
MGLRTMKWDEWIELDNQYLHYHAIKARRIAERGALCSRTDPRAFEAALELLDELASYLPQRYPSLFTRTSTGLTNTATHETFDLGRTQLRRNGGPREDPMQLAGRLLQDDVALMIEGADGRPRLLAGSILLAGFWRLTDKFGLDLAAIHTSGDVPGYDAKLDRPMANFFRRLAPDAPVLRNNYFVQVDDGLAWSSSIGREDDAGIGWATAEKDRAIAAHHFRSERQSLRRLPRSGAVVFTIRTYFVPITELAAEPGVPGRLASAVRAWGDDVGRYKGREKYGRVLLEFLDAKHAEQVAAGLDFGAEEERSSYPW